MTTYAYSLTLNDTECIALVAALDHYSAVCDARFATGDDTAAYGLHRLLISDIKARLHRDATLTSTSTAIRS